MKTIAKGPFLGLNNRLPPFSLHKDKVGNFLSSTDNIDIDNAGNILRRNAATRIQAITGAHSLFMTSETTGYLVIDSIMYAITLPTYTQTLFKALTSNAPVYYAEHNGTIYYSNEVDSGRIKAGVWQPWAMTTPDAPVVTTITGTLPKGKYRVAVSYSNSTTGEEGGASASTSHELTSPGALRVALPGASAGATHVLVYASSENGAVPFLATTQAVSQTTVDITAQATGRDINQRFEAPLPAGRPFIFMGALCSIAGGNIYQGLQVRPGYYLPAEGRIPFPAAVSNVVPTDSGAYVIADKTYWFPGAVLHQAEKLSAVLPYGGVKGTAFVVPDDSKTVGWFSEQGIVLADALGQVKTVMADNIDLTAPAVGYAEVFADRGYLRVVSCGWCLNLETLAATSYSDYDFTSTSGGFATKADGLYLLTGTGKVAASAGLGKESFGTEAEKALPAAYLGYASASPLSLTVGTPDGATYDYPARSCSENLDVHRVDPGRGLRANWYDLTLTNLDGADFTLASVAFAPAATSRRI